MYICSIHIHVLYVYIYVYIYIYIYLYMYYTIVLGEPPKARPHQGEDARAKVMKSMNEIKVCVYVYEFI
jgi:hypothetical protein